MKLSERRDQALDIAVQAGALALSYFEKIDQLVVDRKGHQDFVSQADREVEDFVRTELARAFPDDAIVGEERAPRPGRSGFTWVIDPIDGTTNFINAIPAWVVALAGVENGETCIGIIRDACHDESHVAVRGHGARLNGKELRLGDNSGIGDGSIGVGFSNRVGIAGVECLVHGILHEGGVFQRNGSGALSLAYVAAGRLLGYSEEHMNAWDCLAGQLLVAEAGGCVEQQDADAMIADGGRVIAAAPGVYDDLLRISKAAFGD